MIRFTIWAIAVCVGLLPSPGGLQAAAIINVPGDEPTIQAGVDAATSGDTVLIAAGTYRPSNPITISGKDITLRGDGGPGETVIDGENLRTLLVVQNVAGNGVTIDGLGFIRGRSTETFHGGCAVFQSALGTVANSRFEGCQNNPSDGGNSGGAIKISNASSVRIQNSEFVDNRSYSQGGAVHFLASEGAVFDSTFIGNISRGQSSGGTFTNRVPGGGGVKVTNGSGLVEIRNNIFESNEASFAGGAISVFDGSADIINNWIIGNGRSRFGGGIHLETDDRDLVFRVLDNIIEDNFATNEVNDDEITSSFDNVSGGGLHLNFRASSGGFTSSSVEIRNNDFSQNSALDSRCTSNIAGSDCGRGGAMELFSGPHVDQLIVGNLIEKNRADINGAASFDKIALVFVANKVIGNLANFIHPGIGCVVGGGDTPVACVIERNFFISNAYFDGGAGLPTGNDTGAIHVRRNSARIVNNVFAGNIGHHGTVFIAHETSSFPDAFSEVVHNTFHDNHTERAGFATLRLQGLGTVRNNAFIQGVRAVRIDDFADPEAVIAENNFFDFSDIVGRVEGTNYATVSDLNSDSKAMDNLSVVPGFLDSPSGNFRLMEQSEMVDAVSCVSGIGEDIERTTRPFGSQCDIGAFEFFIPTIIFKDGFES